MFRKKFKDVPSELRKGLFNSVIDGALTNVYATLTSGIFLIGFALLLGANEFQIGVLAALPLIANVAQVFAAFFIENTGKTKGLCLFGASLSRIIWLTVLFLPFPLFDGVASYRVWILVLVVGVSSFISQFGNASWLSWISSFVPRRILGRFFGFRNVVSGISALSVTLLGGQFIDLIASRGLPRETAFVMVFGFGILSSLVALYFLAKIPYAAYSVRKMSVKSFRKVVKKPLKDKAFSRLVQFSVYWNFAVNFLSPFFTVYMIVHLGLSLAFIAIITVVYTLAKVWTAGMWGNFLDKFGSKPVLAFLTPLGSLMPLVYIFVTPKNAWILLPVHLIMGVIWSGIELNLESIGLRLTGEENRSVYLSVLSAFSGVSSALAPIIGGILATLLANYSFTVWLFTVNNFIMLFIIGFVLRITGSLMVVRIVEPTASNIDTLVKEMKQVKFMSLFIGIYDVTQFVIRPVSIASKQLVYLATKTSEGTSYAFKGLAKGLNNSVTKLKVKDKSKVKGELKKISFSLDILKWHSRKDKSLSKKIIKVKQDVNKQLKALDKVEDKDLNKNIKDLKKDIKKPLSYVENKIK